MKRVCQEDLHRFPGYHAPHSLGVPLHDLCKNGGLIQPDLKPKQQFRVEAKKAPEVKYRRTSISGTKKAQITFPLRHFFPLKVVK
jgi:hypothetical protein